MGAQQAAFAAMRIRSVRHKGLRRLITEGDPSGLQPQAVDKIARIIAFLQDMGAEDELPSIPNWKAHRLTGERRGRWSLVVTRNWRITFAIDDGEIVDLDYEDDH